MIINNEAVSLYNQGTKYVEKGNFKKGMPYLKKSLAMVESKECLVNLGNCYRALGDDKNMFKCYRRAISEDVGYLTKPKSVSDDSYLHALNNLGLAEYTYGNDDKAIELYGKAIKKNHEFWEAWWNCSTATLRQASSGDLALFDSGWEMYNARFLKKGPIVLKNRRADLEYWTPGTHVGAIVVLVEQGIGDNIMFGRYLAELRTFADRVYVQCDEFTECIFSDYICVRDAADIPEDCVAYPMCSLASAFKHIPAGDWLRGKFGTREFGEGYNVGIVWAGSATHANNAYRSVAIGRFNRLAKHCNLYSLSPGKNGNKNVRDLGIKTWTDTAECINGLDLVISVDTSVAHMAGSLGKETWLLQPYKETDFRWGNGVHKCVWYNDIEIYENPQDWEYVFDCVERDLAERVYATNKST